MYNDSFSTPFMESVYQIPAWVIFCNAEGKILDDDERAIKRCFDAVPGDPLDNVKGWRANYVKCKQ